MNYILTDFEPQNVLRHFEDICSIPHGSGNERALSEHIMALANANGLYAVMDESNNVFVRVPASEGMENVPPLLLQGHLDMVCVHRPELDIDMKTTPVKLVLDGNILRADGTSLGADNGDGMAFMMAMMEQPDIVHPPLELLFTTEEEVGCVGVSKFDTSLITARRMITMDCGSLSSVNLGSAGVGKFRLSRNFTESAFNGEAVKVTIDGLLGGHTGSAPGLERGNAVDFMGRILTALCDEFEVRLVSANMPGAFVGSQPCYIDFTFGTAKENLGRAVEIISGLYEDFREEVLAAEPDFTLTIENTKAQKAASFEDTRALGDLTMTAPTGVKHRSMKVLSRLRASSLVPIVEYNDGKFEGYFSIRANLESYMDDLLAKMKTVCRLCGFELTRISRTYGWVEKEGSEMCRLVKQIHTDLIGGEMGESVIHGGLEAGFISRAIPDMDIIGISPKSSGAHTVNECLYLDSMQPMWEFLKEIMRRLCI